MTIQEIKQLFYAYRNGVVADTLRRSGMQYRMIFGLNVPQLAAIAREIGYDNTLAEALWADQGVRESRLLSAYLFNPAELPMERALQLCEDLQTQEEADILAFRLLRHLSYRTQLATLLKSTACAPLAARALERFT